MSTRINQTDIKNRNKNRESRQQQGLGPGQLSSQRSKSVQYNIDKIQSDIYSNLSALFQDSDNSSIKIEQDIPRLATQDADAIINQMKLKPITHNLYLYMGHYKGNKVLVIRQRDDLEVRVDDMNEETDSAKGELTDDSDSTRTSLLGGDW